MNGGPGAALYAQASSFSATRPSGYVPAVAAAAVRGTIDGGRRAFWDDCLPTFDVVVIGGGIQGACIYHHLARGGHRVLLVDRGDFGGGTSQASAMLVWGGLLYMKSASSIGEVCRLSAARDAMLRDYGTWTEPHTFRFVLPRNGRRRPAAAQSALWLYWLLGGCRRRLPRRERSFAETAFLRRPAAAESLLFEEGRLRSSDAGFVL